MDDSSLQQNSKINKEALPRIRQTILNTFKPSTVYAKKNTQQNQTKVTVDKKKITQEDSHESSKQTDCQGFIEDIHKRTIASKRRKVALLKKCIELHSMTSLKVALVIEDAERDDFILYNSNKNENLLDKFFSYEGTFREVCNKDYKNLIVGRSLNESVGKVFFKDRNSWNGGVQAGSFGKRKSKLKKNSISSLEAVDQEVLEKLKKEYNEEDFIAFPKYKRNK